MLTGYALDAALVKLGGAATSRCSSRSSRNNMRERLANQLRFGCNEMFGFLSGIYATDSSAEHGRDYPLHVTRFDLAGSHAVCCRTARMRDHVSGEPAWLAGGINSIPCRSPIVGTLAKSSGTVRTSRFTSLKNAEG
jgi:hypothetical protein